jgi:hypothetical protein
LIGLAGKFCAKAGVAISPTISKLAATDRHRDIRYSSSDVRKHRAIFARC